MKCILMIVVIGMISTACLDSDSHNVKSIVINSTGHEIVIQYHKAAFLSSTYEPDTLHPWEVKALMIDAGSGPSQTYPLKYSTRCDSITVVFDNSRESTHFDRDMTGPNGIAFTSPRSLFNPINWVEDVKKNTRKRFIADYTYTFTEQDYLDAN